MWGFWEMMGRLMAQFMQLVALENTLWSLWVSCMELNSKIASKDSDLDMLHHSSIHISSVCMPLLKNSPVRSFGRVCDSLCYKFISKSFTPENCGSLAVWRRWLLRSIERDCLLHSRGSAWDACWEGLVIHICYKSPSQDHVFFWNSDDWLIKSRWWISYDSKVASFSILCGRSGLGHSLLVFFAVRINMEFSLSSLLHSPWTFDLH